MTVTTQPKKSEKFVQMHTNGVYRKRIGKQWNKHQTELVPAEWYFQEAGTSFSKAVVLAASKKEEWKSIKENWSELAPKLAPFYPSVSEPFWPTLDTTEKVQTRTAETSVGISVDVSIADAKKVYLDYQRSRLGMKGSKGLKQSSLTDIERTLECSLRPLTLTDSLNSLDLNAVRETVDGWYADANLTERTALNYARRLKAFLDFCAENPDWTYSLPKGATKVFELGTPEPEPYIPTTEEMQKIIAQAKLEPDWMNAAVMMGLNCGFTPVDVMHLKTNEVSTDKNGTFIWRKREKTSHQNTFNSLHWLFPESVKALEGVKVDANGLWMDQTTPNLTKAFQRLLDHAGIVNEEISFKSLRKFSAQMIMNQNTKDMAQKFLGHKISGVLGNYVKQDFTDLTAAVKEYHLWLKSEKIL